MVAAVVAISEGLLYLIWQARRDKSSRQRATLRTRRRAKKNDSGDEDNVDKDLALDVSDGLRKRQVRRANE